MKRRQIRRRRRREENSGVEELAVNYWQCLAF
jgi:hypothetical protein